MKVIKRGIKPSERIWQGTCHQCRSELEAQESEMTHITHDQREGGYFSWEKCPVCGAGTPDTGYGGALFYRISK